MNKTEDSRLKMLKILQTLNDICSIKNVKLPKNIGFLFRKLYKYTKPHANLLKIGFPSNEDNKKGSNNNRNTNDISIITNNSSQSKLINKDILNNLINNEQEHINKTNLNKINNLDGEDISLNISMTSNITNLTSLVNTNHLSKNHNKQNEKNNTTMNNDIKNTTTQVKCNSPNDIRVPRSNNNTTIPCFTTYNIDDTWRIIILTIKEWIYKFFYLIYESINSNEAINKQFELFLFYSLILIKELCFVPPVNLVSFKTNVIINPSILYFLADYFIILEQPQFFINNYDLMLKYTTTYQHSYKYVVLLKKIFIKYFFKLDEWSLTNTNKKSNSIFSDIIKSDIQDFSDTKFLNYKYNKIFKEIIELTIDNLKAEPKPELSLISLNNKGSLLYNIFVKNKSIVSKELDGSNIMDFFSILNTCEDYSLCHLNNITGFSIILELGNFLFQAANENEHYYERIFTSFNDMLSVLINYCIRIFDQSENYLESNKNQTVIEKNNDYNHSFIEAAVLESLKVINLVCLIDNSLVSTINMRIMQVYERIALKQSGLVFLEILQFFINNNYLMIIDLDNYISQFFKLKLKFNYKYEMLSFSTLEFLYKNRNILNEMTQVFNTYFPIILKIFATFPKYIDSKFFILIEYMTKPNTISEMFNYILDLPSVILIIENFECYLSIFNNNNSKLDIDEIFKAEHVKLIKFLLRDESYGQENLIYFPSIETYNKQLDYFFKSLVFTTRVHSTTKIVPKLMNKYLDVIIEREDIDSACEAISLVFDRFSYFNENKNYVLEIRSLLLKKLEEIFKKWNNIVRELEEKIIYEVKNNFNNITKRELICLLCWALGEYLTIEDYEFEEKELGVKRIFECLEILLRENILFFSNKKDDVSDLNVNQSVEEVLEWYSTYFIEKTTEEEILNERILNILIIALGKLAIKFKSFVSRTVKCFQDIQNSLINKNLFNTISEMLICLIHVSVSTEYLI